MHHDMKRFVREILKSPRRRAIPIMTSPGIDLIGAKPVEVFRDGALQFRCIQALAGAVHADALVTFMDLSVEAEAFGSPVRYSEHENPTVSGSIASTPEAIDALAVPEVGAISEVKSFSSVLFPAPFGPISPKMVPGWISSETRFTAV